MNAASLDTCNLPAIMSPARIGAFIQFHDEDSQMSINKLLIAMTLGLALAACSKQEAQDAAATADAAAATETQAAADQAATAEAAAPAEAAAETTAADDAGFNRMFCRGKIIKEEFPAFPKEFIKLESVLVRNSNGIWKC